MILSIQLTDSLNSRSGDRNKPGLALSTKEKFWSSTASNFFNLGIETFESGDYHQSIIFFQKVLELEPNTPEAANNIGICLMKLGEFNAAIGYFDLAIELSPDRSKYYLDLGQAFEWINEFSLARDCYDRAFKIFQTSGIACFNKAKKFL